MSSSEDETAKAADLRFTEHQRNQVRVERDLSGGGHLARGDRTKMSRLNFSARARPADPGERDAAFTARPTDAAPADPAAHDSGLIDKVARFFGR